jgi:hypothetical protein
MPNQITVFWDNTVWFGGHIPTFQRRLLPHLMEIPRIWKHHYITLHCIIKVLEEAVKASSRYYLGICLERL